MAIKTEIVTITTTATPLSFAPSAGQTETDTFSGAGVLVQAVDGASTFYVGGPDVTPSNGWPVTGGAPFSMDIDWKEILYGVVASGSVNVYLLVQGV